MGRGDSGYLAARLPVLDLAVASVRAVQAAAARAAGTSVERVDADRVDAERVAAAFIGDLRVDGQPVEGFAPLSGFFRTADGWVRTHANYPHHRERLLGMLDLPESADRAALAARLAAARAQDVEDDAAVVGAVAVRVRAEDEWRASGPGRAAADTAPVRSTRRTDALHTPRALGTGSLPLSGVRILDLTRVIAGPVATRTLALLGADVLRIDSPRLLEIAWQHLDTGQGKRTALLDLRTADGLVRAQALLDSADVLVTGYRPGSVEALGLRLPAGVVHARITAWGDDGPWAGRRGFDSIVQAASGIALVESIDGTTPGALPAQALDHATGYLLAAAVIGALVDRAADGLGRDIDGALARTAQVLLDAPDRTTAAGAAVSPSSDCAVTHTIDLDGVPREVTTARPAFVGLAGDETADYAAPAQEWGTDAPTWL